MGGMARLAALLLCFAVSAAHGQTVLQSFTSSTGYAYSGQATAAAKCEALRSSALSGAAGYGYTVSNGTVRDPVSGLSFTYNCEPLGAHDPAPRHPVAGHDMASPPRTACPPRGKTRVFLAFGQSNAANSGGARYTAGPDVYAFSNGECFPASDPLPGASGTDGSVWSRLGDRLAANWPGYKVLIAAIGEGGSSVADWAPGGGLNARLRGAVSSLLGAGYPIEAMLWAQGEVDAADPSSPKPSAETYRDTFLAMLGSVRRLGVPAPVYVAKSTICNFRDADSYPPPDAVLNRDARWHLLKEANKETIRRAQHGYQPAGVVNGYGVRRGPDTDKLGPEYRFDGCHFSARGLDAAAWLWLKALTAP